MFIGNPIPLPIPPLESSLLPAVARQAAAASLFAAATLAVE